MDKHVPLLLPALVRLFKPGTSDAPLTIQRAALRTLGRLLPCMEVRKDTLLAYIKPYARTSVLYSTMVEEGMCLLHVRTLGRLLPGMEVRQWYTAGISCFVPPLLY